MLKNECSRNCWLAAAVVGLLVWIFNATLLGGFVLGLVAFFLLGRTLIWLVCSGRGGAAEDAEVLDAAPAPAPSGHGVLDRAEQAVVDAGLAFSASAMTAMDKGRRAWQDRRQPPPDHGILERAGSRLEDASEAMIDAMDALAARGKGIVTPAVSKDTAPPAVAPLAALVSPGGRSAVASDPLDAVVMRQPEPAPEPVIEPVSQPAPRSEAGPTPPKAGKTKSEKPGKAEKGKGMGKGKGKAGKSAKLAKAGADGVLPGKEVLGKSRVKKFAEAVADAAAPVKGKAKKAKADKPAKAEKSKARKARPDALQDIKGIGPQLEGALNENGVTRFAQIAAWSDADIDHHAALLGRMGGRIRSDDWVGQAALLVKGKGA
ncbi:MAG: hypothetical protein Q4G26_14320 [Paracoccus sp. (in: a-proteobacteria)]|nr:hypothetical protein [Paracoccus sp. (in: a-proteobacteria)]